MRAPTIMSQMALLAIIVATCIIGATADREMVLANITRFSAGDLFSLVGSDCGPTRCMEASHGTALAALGGGDGCVCQCRRETPAYREDQRVCASEIDECRMATFGRGTTKPQIPFVFLPLKGQIIYPSKEIIFTDVDDAICAVTSAQYLSSSGWVTIRDLLDNDVPFSLYRDEGSTFLQWRGSLALHARLEGRLVAVHVLCSTLTPSRLAASCAAFRVAGATHSALLDVRSIPFHAGEVVTTDASPNQGLTVLEALAIGVCALMLIFIYAAGIIFYIHYKQKQKKKDKDAENNIISSDNGSSSSRIDLDNVTLKTNPLLKMDDFTADFGHDTGFSDVSELTEDTVDSSVSKSNKFQKLNHSVISAMVHTRRSKKPSRPSIRMTASPEKINERLQRRSASPDIERAPHSELAIVDCSMENSMPEREASPPSIGESIIRRKLYFNPVFFETELLKNPPPAAVEFLEKIREVMSIAKDKMTTKRFIPSLSDIPEEASHHAIDLGWDIPCARGGRRFSAISLKRENSRRAMHCGGCPGCDNREPIQKPVLTRSNSCKSCVSEDYKQRIVRKWLDEVPIPPPAPPMLMPVKSVTKVDGPPRVISPKPSDDERVSSPELQKLDKKKTRKVKDIKQIKEVEKNEIFLQENIQELPPKETHVKEQLSKKESKLMKPPKPPKIVREIIKTSKDTKAKEEISKRSMSPLAAKQGVKPEGSGITKSQISAPIIHTPPQSSSPVEEKRSPSNHASRRIRKKLPPPPPPPTKPPKSKPLENQTEAIYNEISTKTDEAPIPPEFKIKMEAVIRELNTCGRSETDIKHEPKSEEKEKEAIPPKIIIPVTTAPDAHYFSDDNLLSDMRRKPSFVQRQPFMDFDSMERMMLKRRRFSLACGPELIQRRDLRPCYDMETAKQTLTRSWRDVRKAVESYHFVPPRDSSVSESRKSSISEIFIENNEPAYDNIAKPGPLTIQVTGSPVETRRNLRDEFDPDTLDRKPRRDSKKRVEKILLKSGGSFKNKVVSNHDNGFNPAPESVFSRKIGSLRQIYEAKAKEDQMRLPYYERRGSLPYVQPSDIIRQLDIPKDPSKFRREQELSPKFTNAIRDSPGEKRRTAEERERYSQYLKAENIVARKSGRRSNRTRSRRTDLRKIYRTEDSGYLSTDSNESKRRANYLMQLRPKNVMLEQTSVPPAATVIRTPILPHNMESDTDDMESVCDGRSESGGESIETDSVFFGNFDESKQMLAELGVTSYEFNNAIRPHEQIDSGFMGETNIILSGDSDSEHRSVISIVTGRDGRASATSVKKLDETPYIQSVDC